MRISWAGCVLFVLVTIYGVGAKELEVKAIAEQIHVNEEKILNIHIVAHTHDDVGWLKTVEQYYHGRNSTIQRACVRCILDSVISALQHSSSRKFTYVEMAFFSMWWDAQSNDMKESVRELVKNGQLSFANGGWCMHDEATTHYMGMIDQTTLGHQFLKEELDYVPTVGWQLDPFGHSATQASLLTSEAGFNALYFGRIDYQDLEQRQEAQECEGVWDSSQNLKNSSIFWGLTGSYMGNYGAPGGFCFDIFCTDDPLVGLGELELKSRIENFLSKIKVQVDQTKGSNVMVTMGSDFQYESAMENFQNLDILIENINNGLTDFSGLIPDFDKINAFYSTPELYTSYKYTEFVGKEYEQIHSLEESSILRSKPSLSIKTDDFFPYSDCDHCFWTGYFSSRPSLKKLERVGSSFLHAARQIQALFGNADQMHNTSEIYNLETAMAIAQHHDAVSGTSKEHVANDYAMKIQAGINEAAKYAANIIRSRLIMDIQGTDISNLSYCQLRNVSVCHISQAATTVNETDIYVVIYNALGSKRSDVLSLPVSCEGPFIVEKREQVPNSGFSWKKVSSTLFPNTNAANVPASAPYKLYFDTGIVAPVGMSLYRVRKDATKTSNNISSHGIQSISSLQRSLRNRQKKSVIIQNDVIEIKFEMGVMTKITLLAENIDVDIKQEWGYYTSFQQSLVDQKDSDAGFHSVELEQCIPTKSHVKEFPWVSGRATQNSGAYIFRPSSPTEQLNKIGVDPSKTKVFSDDILTEIHTGFEVPWIKQITRITKGQPYVDIEYTIGPIPINDQKGKEVVTRFISDIENNSTFQTDSNGREFLSRVRSARQSFEYKEFEPIAGNYYPVNAAIFLEDDRLAMSILTDRSQGGTSTRDGVIELMVQRRTLRDDGRGVGEAMNETDSGVTPYPPYGDASRQGNGVVITGKHRLLVGKGRVGASLARSQMDAMFSPLHLFAASAPSNSGISFHTNSLSAIEDYLHPSIQLITTKVLAIHETDIVILLRLGHAYGYGESDDLSTSVKIDVSTILTGYVIKSIVEKTLTGNQDRAEWNTKKMSWNNNSYEKTKMVFDTGENDSSFTILIKPMEIRTLEVHAQIIS